MHSPKILATLDLIALVSVDIQKKALGLRGDHQSLIMSPHWIDLCVLNEQATVLRQKLQELQEHTVDYARQELATAEPTTEQLQEVRTLARKYLGDVTVPDEFSELLVRLAQSIDNPLNLLELYEEIERILDR